MGIRCGSRVVIGPVLPLWLSLGPTKKDGNGMEWDPHLDLGQNQVGLEVCRLFYTTSLASDSTQHSSSYSHNFGPNRLVYRET